MTLPMSLVFDLASGSRSLIATGTADGEKWPRPPPPQPRTSASVAIALLLSHRLVMSLPACQTFVEKVFGLVPLALFAARQDPLDRFLLVVGHARGVAFVGGGGDVLNSLKVL